MPFGARARQAATNCGGWSPRR